MIESMVTGLTRVPPASFTVVGEIGATEASEDYRESGRLPSLVTISWTEGQPLAPEPVAIFIAVCVALALTAAAIGWSVITLVLFVLAAGLWIGRKSAENAPFTRRPTSTETRLAMNEHGMRVVGRSRGVAVRIDVPRERIRGVEIREPRDAGTTEFMAVLCLTSGEEHLVGSFATVVDATFVEEAVRTHLAIPPQTSKQG